MRAVLLLSVLVLLSVGGPITCIRIRELRIPTHVAEGTDAELACKFDLEGQRLYSVKWLKDDKEFYTYKPGGNRTLSFKERGVTVDVDRSSMTTVTLVYMTSESAGVYRCEVTGEAPSFRRVAAKGYINVDLLPKGGPQVTGLQESYHVNDPLMLNCSSLGARPESEVRWLVNGVPAPHAHLRGPWKSRSVHPIDAFDKTLELSFGVMSSHFKQGVMTITCEATLAPLYREEAVFRYQMLQRARQGKLIETTTAHNFRTTEKPWTSTIKIQFKDSSNEMVTWSVTDEEPPKTDNASGILDSSIFAILLCVSLGTLF